MAASSLEKTTTDLKVARFVVHKLGETFDSFQVHSSSIFSLVEQWRNLQASFTEVNMSLESRVKELEAKEREAGVVANKVQRFQEEVEVKRKSLEFGEKTVNERIAKVQARENDVRKWLEVINVHKKQIGEREKAVVAKERELAEGLERVRNLDEDEARVRKVELEANECRKAVEMEERRVSKIVEELEGREKRVELRESRVDERCKAVEIRENRVDERFKELEVKEMDIKVREEAVEAREMELREGVRAMEAREDRLMEDQQALDLKAEDMDKLYSLVELRETETNERFTEVESKEKELKLREANLKVQCEELKLKEKNVIERLSKLKSDEKDLRDSRRALEDKKNEIDVRFASLEAREGEVNKRSRDLEVKEMDVNAKLVVVEAKEAAWNVQWGMLEVKRKEVDEFDKAIELKEKKVEELCRELELKEKQINESIQGSQLKQGQMDGRFKEMEAKEKEISERCKEMELKEKQINRRKKAQELIEKQFEDSKKALELKERQVDERFHMLELKLKQMSELSQEREPKQQQRDGLSVCDHEKVSELKDKEINVPSELTELNGTQVNQHLEIQKLDVEQKKTCSDKLGLKGKQMADGDTELKSNQTNTQQNVSTFKEIQKGDMLRESEDKQNDKVQKVVNIKENQVSDKVHEVGPKPSDNGDNKLAVNSDRREDGGSRYCGLSGKILQFHLNERFTEHGSMNEEIVKLLESMTNPAKIVLDAINGFFPPHLCNKDGVASDTSVVRSSCLLLLEHLMNMRPFITKTLKKDATFVAVAWRAKMEVEGETEVVALAFLLLLVTYKLNNVVKKDDVRRLCGIVDQHKLAPRIRQKLGVLKRANGSSGVEDTIKEPIQSDSLLADNGHNALDPLPAKTPDIHSSCRSMDEKGVRSYLMEHVKEYDALKDKILDALRYASDPAKLVLSVCNISVTDPVQNHADLNNTICIFLLKQLMKLAPSISEEVTNEARVFAEILKAKLKGSNNPLFHYRFLQFVASYKLANSYHSDELLSYFKVFYCSGEEVYRPDENAYLCFALGLAKKIPGVIKNLIDKKKLLCAVKFICVFKLERTFPPVPLLEEYLEFIKRKVDEKRKEGSFKEKVDAENMESSALKSIIISITNFKLESQLPLERFVARMKELEKEKDERLSANCSRKRRASPMPSSSTPSQEKRPRSGPVQQSQPVPPVYLLPFPPGPPPPMPPSYGPPAYNRLMSAGPPNTPFYPPGDGHGVGPRLPSRLPYY
ncbi:hypothetical protein vseg_021427 [Gypsophila vaccaria]